MKSVWSPLLIEVFTSERVLESGKIDKAHFKHYEIMMKLFISLHFPQLQIISHILHCKRLAWIHQSPPSCQGGAGHRQERRVKVREMKAVHWLWLILTIISIWKLLSFLSRACILPSSVHSSHPPFCSGQHHYSWPRCALRRPRRTLCGGLGQVPQGQLCKIQGHKIYFGFTLW